MLDLLYGFIISPIEVIVEFTYAFMHRILKNPGLAIVAVSIVIQTLVLPLYKRSDAIQDEERQRQKDMAHWVSHIKRTFKGDERYMMLSTYYREQGYRSWYALKSTSSTLLQIPFFIAAYHYLSNLSELIGQHFLFISDLSRPDAVMSIGGFDINIMPVIMTLINIISGIIYTRDSLPREKIQVHGLALVFLILLYNSPSGLVLYWTVNNIYSLIKNIIKSWAGKRTIKEEAKAGRPDIFARFKLEALKERLSFVYMWEAVFLTVFIGVVIPINIINSSAAEFVNETYGPAYLIASNAAVFAGFFLLWGRIFFGFMKKNEQLIFSLAMFLVTGISVADYMFFGNDMGIMSPLFVYDDGLRFTGTEKIINLIVILILMIVLVLIFARFNGICVRAVQILTVSAVILCIYNSVSIAGQVKEYKSGKEAASLDSDEKILKLSRTGTNVIVIMLDRAIGGYIPFIFDEKPEIAEMFDGFTWYPDTLSFGTFTNYGSPALYGGYEYTPKAMNERDTVSLKDKHNEAMMLMPALFSEAGYKVTVCDPPYGGSYSLIPDLSIYEPYKNVSAYMTQGAYTEEYYKQSQGSYKNKQKNLLVYHCMMKVSPVIVQPILYNKGSYISKSSLSINKDFWDWYSVLVNMIRITDISDDPEDCFISFMNKTTHDISLLKVPEYVPSEEISVQPPEINSAASDEIISKTINGVTLNITNQYQAAHYQCNVAALSELAKWFDYMKKNGCWDNTRIVIASDHGKNLDDLSNMWDLPCGVNIEFVNPLLIVKDFGASGKYRESDEFMTNADVPALALEGLIEDPKNPFTGKDINSDAKKEKQYVTTSAHFNPAINNGMTFDTSDGYWYEVTPGDIFDKSNWRKVDWLK